jgi:transcriptional regulator with XRE-family HTH domain
LSEIDAARRVGEFLDNARWVKSAQVDGEGVKDFLHQMTRKVAGGHYSKLAAMLGSTKTNMHGWFHGRVVPSFPAVVRMAQAFDCLISDVLLNNDIVPRYKPQLAKEALQLHAPRCRSGKVNWTDVQNKIAQVESQELTLTEVAKAAGVDQKYIRRRFLDKAKEIVQASRNRKQRDTAHRATARVDAYCRAHHEVLARGESPTRRRVLAHLESSGIRLSWSDMHEAYWRAREVGIPEKAEI